MPTVYGTGQIARIWFFRGKESEITWSITEHHRAIHWVIQVMHCCLDTVRVWQKLWSVCRNGSRLQETYHHSLAPDRLEPTRKTKRKQRHTSHLNQSDRFISLPSVTLWQPSDQSKQSECLLKCCLRHKVKVTHRRTQSPHCHFISEQLLHFSISRHLCDVSHRWKNPPPPTPHHVRQWGLELSQDKN